MDGQEEQSHQYEWGYSNKEVLEPDAFEAQLKSVFQERDVVSVGEYHDERRDTSFAWLQDHRDEILQTYDWYRMMGDKSEPEPFITMLKLLPPGSQLFDRLTKGFPSMHELRKLHVGRMFAFQVLPAARNAGYTHLVLEGVDAANPARTLERSKDQTGDLLRITMAMMMGMKIHGAYSEGVLSTPVDIANTLFDEVKQIRDSDPNAKVVVYNGASHSMTEPFKKGTQVGAGILSFDASELTYAPKARELWGDRYGAIDLIGGDKSLVGLGHFTHMQQEAKPDQITMFTHGVNQQTFVIK